jgi:hypothetical protein
VTVKSSCLVKARSFHKGKPVSAVSMASFSKVDPWPRIQLRPGVKLTPGVTAKVYDGAVDALPMFEALRPESTQNIESIRLIDAKRENYSVVYSGYLEVTLDEAYEFALQSDDGSRLWIDGQLVVDNDGLHSSQVKTGVAPLAKGLHHLRVEWFNKSGPATRCRWKTTSARRRFGSIQAVAQSDHTRPLVWGWRLRAVTTRCCRVCQKSRRRGFQSSPTRAQGWPWTFALSKQKVQASSGAGLRGVRPSCPPIGCL